MDEKIISIKNVTKTFDKTTILHDISLDIKTGEFVAITGPSGSGKSTLLHILGGVDLPTSGSVHLFGNDLSDISAAQIAKLRSRNIGFVFQFFYLQPYLDVQTNIEISAMLTKMPRHERIERAKAIAKQVGLGDKLSAYPKQLSGGECQRVAIARAIMNQPKVILADEPTGNLDDANTAKIIQLLIKIHEAQGTALVLVTHDERIARLADRRIRIKDGRLETC